MDASGNIIPIVEDDQGEGMKDPLTLDDLLEKGYYKEAMFRADKNLQKLIHKNLQFHRRKK